MAVSFHIYDNEECKMAKRRSCGIVSFLRARIYHKYEEARREAERKKEKHKPGEKKGKE